MEKLEMEIIYKLLYNENGIAVPTPMGEQTPNRYKLYNKINEIIDYINKKEKEESTQNVK